jgi:hypothetical protein
MAVAATAWRLREAARAALAAGRGHEACDLAAAALRLHATPRGRRLHIVALLAAGHPREAALALAAAESALSGATEDNGLRA